MTFRVPILLKTVTRRPQYIKQIIGFSDEPASKLDGFAPQLELKQFRVQEFYEPLKTSLEQ